jgi:ABC-type spermidine/putrescine transport system permease subunit I
MKKKEILLKHTAFFAIFLWILLFFIIPFLNLIKEGFKNIHFALFVRFFLKSNLITIFFRSISMAFATSCITLFIGYGASYIILKKNYIIQNILLLFLSIPFLTNFIIHLAAWSEFLSYDGLISKFLKQYNIYQFSSILFTKYAILIGFIYCYLPYMIFPLFNALSKFDDTLLQASYDLGASRFQTLFRVLVPATKSAILTGFFLVFIPASCEFVIPEVLGGDRTMYYGSVIYNLVLTPSLTPYASLSILFFIILLSLVGYFLYRLIQYLIFIMEHV